MSNKKTYQLALGGICLALTIIFMFGASIAPGVELTLYAISSLFVAVMILESGVKGGIALYLAAVLLGLLIVPNKIGVLPYIGVFGLYGIVKFYIEKLKRPAAQLLLKILFFAAVTALAFTALKGLLFGNSQLPDLPVWALICVGVVMLLLYDVIYTMLIRMYRRRFHKEQPISFELSKKEQEKDRESGASGKWD